MSHNAFLQACRNAEAVLDAFIEHEQLERTPQEWRHAVMFYIADAQVAAIRAGDQQSADNYGMTIGMLCVHWRVRKLFSGERVMEDRADD